MRALVLGDDGVRQETGRPEPVPTAGDVLVEVIRAGICETDLQLIRGYHGFRGVLGHEFVGIARAGAFEGRRVAGEINCSCWTCETCRAGRTHRCPHRTVLGIVKHDGAFADYVAPSPSATCAPFPTRSTRLRPSSSSRWPPPSRFPRSSPSAARTASSSSATDGWALCAQVLAGLLTEPLHFGPSPAPAGRTGVDGRPWQRFALLTAGIVAL
jgi:hypothetical protein